MTWTAPKTWSVGDILTASDMNTYVRDNSKANGLILIDDYTVSGSAVASYDTNTTLGGSIPQIFKSLVLEISARSTAVATNVSGYIRFNNDSASNYHWNVVYGNNSSAGSSNGMTQAQISNANQTPASSASANRFSCESYVIADYTSTSKHKHLVGISSRFADDTAANATVTTSAGLWKNTAAITRIQVLLAFGNIDVGSRIVLYGRGTS